MIKRTISECSPYDAPKHFKMTALRLHGKDESQSEKFWMGMSHFLPGGGAEYDASPTEKIYFVLEGEMTIYDKDNQKIVVSQWESIHIGANEGRTLINETNLPATMLVVINYL